MDKKIVTVMGLAATLACGVAFTATANAAVTTPASIVKASDNITCSSSCASKGCCSSKSCMSKSCMSKGCMSKGCCSSKSCAGKACCSSASH